MSNTLGWVPEEVMEVEGKHNKIKTRESFLNGGSILNGSVIRLFNELSSSVSQFLMDRVKKKKI